MPGTDILYTHYRTQDMRAVTSTNKLINKNLYGFFANEKLVDSPYDHGYNPPRVGSEPQRLRNEAALSQPPILSLIINEQEIKLGFGLSQLALFFGDV